MLADCYEADLCTNSVGQGHLSWSHRSTSMPRYRNNRRAHSVKRERRPSVEVKVTAIPSIPMQDMPQRPPAT